MESIRAKIERNTFDTATVGMLLASLLGCGALHLNQLSSALLGSLAPLADFSFYRDLGASLSLHVLYAGLFGRLIYYSFFILRKLDFSSVVAWLWLFSRGFQRPVSRRVGRLKWRIDIMYSKRGLGLTLFFSFLVFCFDYLGGFSLSFVLVFLVALVLALLPLAAFLFPTQQVLRFLVHKRPTHEFVEVFRELHSGVPARVWMTCLVLPMLFVSWSTGVIRAGHVVEENYVTIFVGRTHLGCYSLLGKTNQGVFLTPINSTSGTPEFLTYQNIDTILPITKDDRLAAIGHGKHVCGDYSVRDFHY